MASCVIDFANEHKDIIPKDILEKMARQDREMNKMYANQPDKLKEMQTEAISYWASEITKFKYNDIADQIKEKTVLDSLNTFSKNYEKKHGKIPDSAAMKQAILSVTEGSLQPNMPGGRQSIEALQRSIVGDYDNLLFTYLENEGLVQYADAENLLPVLEAKKRLIEEGLKIKPEEVGPNPHDRIAAALLRTDFAIQDGYGHSGSAQTHRVSFVNDSGHDPNKIFLSDDVTWKRMLLAALDKEQPMYDTPKGAPPEMIDAILTETRNMIIRGDFAEFDSHRNFNWADPKAYIEYNKMFGSGQSWNGMYAHTIQRAARRQAVIQKLGTRPERTYSNMISRAREINPKTGDWQATFDEAWTVALGRTFADYGPLYQTNEFIKHANTVTGMGVSVFSAVAGDIPAMVTVHHADIGEGLAHAVMDNVSATVQSIQYTLPTQAARDALRDAGINMEEHLLYAEPPIDLAHVTPGYKTVGAKALNTSSGILNKLSRYNQWTNGLKPWTRMSKMSAAKTLRGKLKKYANVQWDNIPVDFRETITSFMDKEDFENFKHMGNNDYTYSGLNKGLIENSDKLTLPQKYLDPIAHMEKEGMGVSKKTIESYIEKEKSNYAHNLKRKAMAMMIQNVNEFIPTPGAKEKRQLGAGKKRHEGMAIIISNLSQYKSTALAALNQVTRQSRKYNSPVQQAIYIGGRTAMGMFTSMGSHALLYASTHQGTLPWDDENFEGWQSYMMYNMIRGGGAGLVGDYVMGAATDKNRMLGGVVGPTTKLYADIWEAMYEGATGDAKTKEINQVKMSKLLLKNIPFGGSVFLYNFRKGFLDTMDATIKELRRQQQGAQRRRHKYKR